MKPDLSPEALAKGDPAHDRIAAAIRAITDLVTAEPPPIPCVDIVDLRHVLFDAGSAVFGQGEAEGPDRAIRAADAALADIRRQLPQLRGNDMSEGRGPGEGIRKEGEGVGEGQRGDDYKSPLAQREQAQKAGDPKEKQAEAERIARDEARYRRGFPVAGHDRDDDTGRGRERSR